MKNYEHQKIFGYCVEMPRCFAMCGQVVYYLREVIEMCLAFPAKVLAIEGDLATVERAGVTRKASLMLLPEAKVGDFVLIHAGFAMQTIDEREVQIRDALVAEMNGAPRTVEKLL